MFSSGSPLVSGFLDRNGIYKVQREKIVTTLEVFAIGLGKINIHANSSVEKTKQFFTGTGSTAQYLIIK